MTKKSDKKSDTMKYLDSIEKRGKKVERPKGDSNLSKALNTLMNLPPEDKQKSRVTGQELEEKTLTLDECKSYASEANLMKGLKKHGLLVYRPLICRNSEGRWTAVFSLNYAMNVVEQNYVGFASQHGFMTI